jgi:enoyl-CoA hydratase/carnithine racemase
LFNRVVDAPELDPLVRRYAHDLATTVSPSAVATTKRQLWTEVSSPDVGEAVETSKRLLNEMMGEPDYREGVAALRERRPPRFR